MKRRWREFGGALKPEFMQRLHRVLEMALRGGIRDVPLRQPSDGKSPFVDDKHRRRFVAATHRAFELAQDEIVRLLQELSAEPDGDEQIQMELVVRKIADGIASHMLQFQTHVMRRFRVHDTAPAIDLATVKRALLEANKLNAESRQTFALVADLTTFIHVADILRIDFRDRAKFTLIELKSGKVNDVLRSALEQYAPEPAVLERVMRDPGIQEQHRKQALRMMKQRIRLRQAEEVIEKDQGIDPGLGVPILLGGPTIMNEPFDKALDGVCEAARKTGYGAAIVDGCFHIAAGYSTDLGEARKRALASSHHLLAMASQQRPDGFDAIRQEVLTAVGADRGDNFVFSDLLANNLHSVATRPFLFWAVNPTHLNDLISQNLRLIGVFDLQKFFWLARREGANVQFASRRETEEAKAKIGSINILTFGHRAITYPLGEITAFFTTGLLSRIINEQMRPLQLIREMLLPDPGKVAEFVSWAKNNEARPPGRRTAPDG